jgi:hypothetical protein
LLEQDGLWRQRHGRYPCPDLPSGYALRPKVLLFQVIA